jgi:hypothetical protein
MFSNGRFSDSFLVQYPTNGPDLGPRNGRFPTHPFLVNGPVVDHETIDALYPPGSQVRNGGTVLFDNPDRRNAWARQYSLGYERQLGATVGISVDYIRSEQRDQYVHMELNPLLRASTVVAEATPRRITPLVGTVGEWAASVQTITNEGYVDYDSVQISATKRQSNGWTARVSYAFSRARGNTATGQGGLSASQFLDDMRLDREIGPAATDRPHILTISTSYDVPRTGGLKLSAVYSARSGSPFSMRDTSVDHDQNGFTDNEYLAPGPYTFTAGDETHFVDYQGGRNGGRGPGYQRLDMRAGYRFRLNSGQTIDAFLDVFNALDTVNFDTPGASNVDRRLTATFLQITETSNESTPRTAQLNVRFGF